MAYYQQNTGAIKARTSNYRKANKEYLNAQRREAYKKEEVRLLKKKQAAQNYQKNRKKILAKQRFYRIANAQKIKEKNALYYKKKKKSPT